MIARSTLFRMTRRAAMPVLFAIFGLVIAAYLVNVRYTFGFVHVRYSLADQAKTIVRMGCYDGNFLIDADRSDLPLSLVRALQKGSSKGGGFDWRLRPASGGTAVNQSLPGMTRSSVEWLGFSVESFKRNAAAAIPGHDYQDLQREVVIRIPLWMLAGGVAVVIALTLIRRRSKRAPGFEVSAVTI